ncbi:MAG: hypothetical protein WD037_05640 [Balneolales bacterium]
MSFLSSESLQIKLPAYIKPFHKNRIKHAGYELSLGNETYITDKNKKHIHTDNDPQAVIKPGQFALLITNEEIKIPLDKIAFISIKAGKKFKGLVNVSGFHVDPGFQGKLKFTVFNAAGKSINLSIGDPLFIIWFAELDRPTADGYNGKNMNQNHISSEDIMNIQGELASPQVIKNELDNLKLKVNILLSVSVGLFTAILVSLFI